MREFRDTLYIHFQTEKFINKLSLILNRLNLKEVNSKQAKENNKKLSESCMIMNEVTSWVRGQFLKKKLHSNTCG